MGQRCNRCRRHDQVSFLKHTLNYLSYNSSRESSYYNKPGIDRRSSSPTCHFLRRRHDKQTSRWNPQSSVSRSLARSEVTSWNARADAILSLSLSPGSSAPEEDVRAWDSLSVGEYKAHCRSRSAPTSPTPTWLPYNASQRGPPAAPLVSTSLPVPHHLSPSIPPSRALSRARWRGSRRASLARGTIREVVSFLVWTDHMGHVPIIISRCLSRRKEWNLDRRKPLIINAPARTTRMGWRGERNEEGGHRAPRKAGLMGRRKWGERERERTVEEARWGWARYRDSSEWPGNIACALQVYSMTGCARNKFMTYGSLAAIVLAAPTFSGM